MDVVSSAASIALAGGVNGKTAGQASSVEGGFAEILLLEPPPPGEPSPTAEVVGEGEVAAKEPNAQPQELDPNPEAKTRRTRKQFAIDPAVLAPLAVTQPLVRRSEAPAEPSVAGATQTSPAVERVVPGGSPDVSRDAAVVESPDGASEPTDAAKKLEAADRPLSGHGAQSTSDPASTDPLLNEVERTAPETVRGENATRSGRRPRIRTEAPAETSANGSAAPSSSPVGEAAATSEAPARTSKQAEATASGAGEGADRPAAAGRVSSATPSEPEAGPAVEAPARSRSDRAAARATRSAGAAGTATTTQHPVAPEGTKITVLRAPETSASEPARQPRAHRGSALATPTNRPDSSRQGLRAPQGPEAIDDARLGSADRSRPAQVPATVPPLAAEEGSADLPRADQAKVSAPSAEPSVAHGIDREGEQRTTAASAGPRGMEPAVAVEPVADSLEPSAERQLQAGSVTGAEGLAAGDGSDGTGVESLPTGSSATASNETEVSDAEPPTKAAGGSIREVAPQGEEEQARLQDGAGAVQNRARLRTRPAPTLSAEVAQGRPSSQTASVGRTATPSDSADAAGPAATDRPAVEALGSPAASLAVEAQVSVADRERDSGIPAAGLEQPQPQAASGPKKLWNWTKWSAVRDAALAQLEAADLVPNSEVRSGQTAPSVREPLLVAPTMLGADASTTQRSRHAATLAESADDKAEASGSTVGRRGRTVDDQATLLTTGGRSAPNAPAIGGEPVGPSSAPMPQATFPAEVEGANEAGTFRTEAAVPSQPMGGVEPEQASSLSTLQAGDRPVRRAHPEVATHKPVEARSGVASPAQGAEQVVPEQADGSSVEPAAPGPQEPEALWPSTEAPAEQPRTDTVRGVSNTGATPASPAVTQAPSVTQPAVQSPATQADGAPALDGRTLRQLSDRVLLLATSRRKDPVVVRLEPRDLGLLTITISQDQNRVEATVAASNEQVRVALQHSAPALQQSLETRGLQLASLSIEAQTSGFGGFGDRAGQPNQSPQQQPLPFRFAEAAPEAARREAGFETPSADKAVDYRI